MELRISFLLADSRRTQQAWRSVLWPVMILVWPPNSWTASLSSRLWKCLEPALFTLFPWSTLSDPGLHRSNVDEHSPCHGGGLSKTFLCFWWFVLDCFGLFWHVGISEYLLLEPCSLDVFDAWGTHQGIEGCRGRCSGTLPAAQGMGQGECWLALAGVAAPRRSRRPRARSRWRQHIAKE